VVCLIANAIKKRKIASSFLLAMTTVFTAPFRGKTIPRPLGVTVYLFHFSVSTYEQLQIALLHPQRLFLQLFSGAIQKKLIFHLTDVG